MKEKLYKVMMCFMSVLSIVLAVLIYTKNENHANNFNEKIGVNIDFGKINQNISNFFDNVIGIDFLKNKKGKDQAVANLESYQKLDNDYFKTEDGSIIALANGTVSYLISENGFATMVIQYDNGVSVTYSLLVEVFVASLDRVNENDVIGAANQFKAIFVKNGEKISYETFFA